jgi:hypothetical protein
MLNEFNTETTRKDSRGSGGENDQYYCNEFASCYHGIYLENGVSIISSATIQYFGSANVAVDNRWTTSGLPLSTSFSLGTRIWDNRNSWPLPIPIRYYFSGNPQNSGNAHYPTVNGSYLTQIQTNANGCTLPPNNKNNIVTISSIKSFDLIVYPNPATDEINFRLDNEDLILHSEVINVTGAVVWKNKIPSKRQSVSCTPWPAGFYILRVYTQNYTVSTRFVVK